MAESAKSAVESDEDLLTNRTRPAARGIRISQDLYSHADDVSRVAHRSVQRQIEYWSQLGRLVEQHLTSGELHALLSQTKVITNIRIARDEVPDADTVLDELERDRRDDNLQLGVTSAAVVYDLPGEGPLLRRRNADGTHSLGTLINGAFVEQHG